MLEADHTNASPWERVEALVMEIAIRVGILETDQTDLRKELGVLTRKHFIWAEKTEQSVSRVKNLESENKALRETTSGTKHSTDEVQDQTSQSLDPALRMLSGPRGGLETGLGSVTAKQRSGTLSFQLHICSFTAAYGVAKLRHHTAPHQEGSPRRLRETTKHSEVPSPLPPPDHPSTHNHQPQHRHERRQVILSEGGEDSQNTTTLRNSQSVGKPLKLPRHRAASTQSGVPSPPPLPSRPSTRSTTLQPGQRIPPVFTPEQGRGAHNSPPPKAQTARTQNPPNRRAARQAQRREKLTCPPRPVNLQKRAQNPHSPQAVRAHGGEEVEPSPESRKLCKRKALDQVQDGTRVDYPLHPENLCRRATPNPPNSRVDSPMLEKKKADCSRQLHGGTSTPLHRSAAELGERKAPPPETSRKRKASKSPSREGARPALRELVYCPPQPRYPWPRRFLNSP
jgi:hypothetical protein